MAKKPLAQRYPLALKTICIYFYQDYYNRKKLAFNKCGRIIC